MDDLPILDQARLELITRGDAALAVEFLAALIKEAEGVLEALRALLVGGEHAAVADLAHSLKGMAAEVGATRLRAAGAALEAEANPQRWPGHVDDASAALAELRSLADNR